MPVVDGANSNQENVSPIEPAATEVATPAAAAPPGSVLQTMLERLMAALVNGPSLNCRPHNSRQRVDLTSLKKLGDQTPEDVLSALLGEARKVTVRARIPQPRRHGAKSTAHPLQHGDPVSDAAAATPVAPTDGSSGPTQPGSDQRDDSLSLDSEAERAWTEQNNLINKFHTIAEDARTYEQDTGVQVLNVGFPLLSLPPGTTGGSGPTVRRILAPIAFIPVTLIVKRAATRSIELACRGEGVDLVSPNLALLSWIEQQTGKAPVFGENGHSNGAADQPADAETPAGIYVDNAGEDPWREIAELVRFVCSAMDVPVPEFFVPRQRGDEAKVDISTALEAVPPVQPAEPPASDVTATLPPESPPAPQFKLTPAPRADDEAEARPAVLCSAVVGLFPMANQGLLRDMQAMAGGEKSSGQVQRFLSVAVESTAALPQDAPAVQLRRRDFSTERLVADADPCQSRAVRLARESGGLLIHGPPGTGKSQTIANIIGDHLASGERVLVVCEKRTALEVVANRLGHMGLGNLLAIVHDPRRDQRELYRALRQQLDDLSTAQIDEKAVGKLKKVDTELQALHDALWAYDAALTRVDTGGAGGTPAADRLSFHELVGQWLASDPFAPNGLQLDAPTARRVGDMPLSEVESRQHDVGEVLRRAVSVRWSTNPWREPGGADLPAFLARPAAEHRATMSACVEAARSADVSLGPAPTTVPPFSLDSNLSSQSDARIALADRLEPLLKSADPQLLQRWAGRSFVDVQAVRARLTEISPYLSTMEAAPLDAELCEAALRGGTPTPESLNTPRTVVQKYVDACTGWQAWLDRATQSAPGLPMDVIARWTLTEQKTADAARTRLETVSPLAEKLSSTPLDAELLGIYLRQPFGLPELLQKQSALETYLATASKWHAFLHRGSRKAAQPVVQHFGLPLSPEGGKRLRDFLSALRARLEVREALIAALGNTGIPDADDDAGLIALLMAHHSALKATAEMDRNAIPPSARSGGAVRTPEELVTRLAGTEGAAAEDAFASVGLTPAPRSAERLRTFLQGLTVRLLLQDIYRRLIPAESATAPSLAKLVSDPDLSHCMQVHSALLDAIYFVATEPALVPVNNSFQEALSDPAGHGVGLADGLRRSPARVAAMNALRDAIDAAGFFDAHWLTAAQSDWRGNMLVTSLFESLAGRIDSLEGIIRVHHGHAHLQDALRGAVQELLHQSAEPEPGCTAIRRAALEGEINRRLKADPSLQGIDGHQIEGDVARYRKLVDKKQDLVREMIRARWVGKQKDRLLSSTGTRLGPLGTDLRRRLALRGEKAMRLRRVIAVGRGIEGGDPLLDLCPVWMVSPETCAQVFPREPVFDVVIFDEASQCRLEEALPVLTRGARVVIAGDPQQLPPTRFFESGLGRSADDDEPETEQALFEAQQSEVEDLLGAALGLDMGRCYLDVHYRSRSDELIEFSNRHFYAHRLQPVPRPPSRRGSGLPLEIHRVAGVYEKRRNEAEAEEVCRIVAEALDLKKPPSIGIACFNLPQRDLIVQRLDERAAADRDFAARLDEARRRQGEGSFEGLFVKNLENVQGDERDDIIISTTYGPDRDGKFHRRFGPVGMPGGGRRLNVLVTRARQRVHVVTSIPAESYRSLSAPPAGQSPGGGWLLFAYLKYAEEVAGERSAAPDSADVAPTGVRVRQTAAPSAFAEALARSMSAAHAIPSDVYWGNDGFCIDLALHGSGTDDATALGVLCDATRYPAADDRVEWDVFRTSMLQQHGWELQRIWTPHFFRDPEGAMGRLAGLVAQST